MWLWKTQGTAHQIMTRQTTYKGIAYGMTDRTSSHTWFVYMDDSHGHSHLSSHKIMLSKALIKHGW